MPYSHVTENTRLRLRNALADMDHARSLVDGLDDRSAGSLRLILEQAAREVRRSAGDVEADLDARVTAGVEERYGLTVTGLLALREHVPAS